MRTSRKLISMKPRALLSASEVDALYAWIDKRLDGIGLETQPEVAARLLTLVADPQTGLREYAEVIKSDPAISGRLLRLANSAYFAQRQPVTGLERACVLLGLERLKAVSLGFYLSRAASTDPGQALSRRVWGEGVYRACLSAEISREVCPGHAPEAFVIGLMLDVGIPIAYKLLGPSYLRMIEEQRTPTRLMREEFASLQFTHVDVGTALVRRWKLPEILAKPIERHHTVLIDEDPGGADPSRKLQRIAYYVGSLQLESTGQPRETALMPMTAERVLGLRPERLAAMVAKSSSEYSAMSELFKDTAETIQDVVGMADRVQHQLIEMIDQTMGKQIHDETAGGPERFVIGSQHVEIQIDGPEFAVAYLSDASGHRIVSHTFKPGTDRAETILDALGLEEVSRDDAAMLTEYLRSLAA
jgi:HD-like signal output (HDOD) protein